jgi:hypothetical protein
VRETNLSVDSLFLPRFLPFKTLVHFTLDDRSAPPKSLRARYYIVPCPRADTMFSSRVMRFF